MRTLDKFKALEQFIPYPYFILLSRPFRNTLFLRLTNASSIMPQDE